MTDAIVWMDKLPDIIKKWVLTLPMVVGAIGASVSAYHYTDKQDIIDMKNRHIHEVAAAFQSTMNEKPAKTVNPSCGNCLNKVKRLEKEINLLKEWH